MTTSVKATGSPPSALSRISETSAIPARARTAPPEKIISAVDLPRSVRSLCSPRTQRTASATLLFPEPLGPTIAVIPSEKWNSVLVANDLYPCNVRCFNRICQVPSSSSSPARRRGAGFHDEHTSLASECTAALAAACSADCLL